MLWSGHTKCLFICLHVANPSGRWVTAPERLLWVPQVLLTFLLVPQVLRSVLLFPTIERMAQSPQGKLMTPLLCKLRYALYMPVYLLSFLPEGVKASLVRFALRGMKTCDESSITTSVNLFSVDCIGEHVGLFDCLSFCTVLVEWNVGWAFCRQKLRTKAQINCKLENFLKLKTIGKSRFVSSKKKNLQGKIKSFPRASIFVKKTLTYTVSSISLFMPPYFLHFLHTV